MPPEIPRPPSKLPSFIFLLADQHTRQLAVDVADALTMANNTVYIEDFMAPIHEGLRAMLELDMRRDLASPSETNRLVVETGEHTEADLIVSLERWFNNNFDEYFLGKLGHRRAVDNVTHFDYTVLFRDATEAHLKKFIEKVPWNRMLFVQLADKLYWGSDIRPEAQWITAFGWSPEATVKAIMEFGQ